MGNKTVLATIVIAALLISAAAGMQILETAKANPEPYSSHGTSNINVSITSPTNQTYGANVQVTITAEGYPGIFYVGYSLDEEPFVELAREKWRGHTFNESVWLNGLTEGTHILVAKAKAPSQSEYVTACTQVQFSVTYVNETPSPKIPEFPTWTSIPILLALGSSFLIAHRRKGGRERKEKRFYQRFSFLRSCF